MAGPLFLGLDLSTQQIKAVLITEDSTVVHESAVAFDDDLPHHGTKSGAVHGPGNGEVTSPVLLWLEAIDLLMERMKAAGVDFASIAAISGAGQQHGSVYWSKEGERVLAYLGAEKSLASQLQDAWAQPNAPIWQDSSTRFECDELEKLVGGAQALADLTGSRAYERFTASQIMKIARSKPEVYAGTSRVSLVSSWIPSLFIGQVAPIEVSDASGMNLMDVLTCKWDAKLVEACGGPDLRGKLGPEPVPGGESLGAVSAYWTKRWGFNGSCIVAPFTGDNPATVVALSTPGDAILSLGTSTTFLLSIPPADTPPARFTTSHLLSHPTTPGAQIAMLCYKNGALAREEIRNAHAGSDWARFNDAVEGSPAGNNGQMGLYFPLPEIIPPGARGTWLFKLQPGGAPTRVDALAPPASHPRAILESQLLSIRARVAHILPANAPHLHRLVLTGGSSANHTIRQLAADLFGIPAYVAEGGKQGAGTGGAVLAKFAWWKTQGRTAGTFEEMIAGQNDRMKLVASPNAEVTKVYDGLVEEYEKCEAEVVKHCS